MKIRQRVTVVLLFMMLACASRNRPTSDKPAPSSPGAASLKVTIVGLKSGDGEVALALFDSAQSFKARTDPVAAGRVSPSDGSAVWNVDELQPGTYAIAAYHDLDGNGKLNRSTIGPPDEPYGFSNDARGTFGPPKFDRAAFELGPGHRELEIELR